MPKNQLALWSKMCIRDSTYTALMPFQTHKDWLTTAAKIRHLDSLSDKIKQLEKELALLKSSLAT